MLIKKLKLLLTYSKDFLFFSILISFLSYFIYYKTGNSALSFIIWFKIITCLVGIFIHQNRKSKEIFFYMNNGIGKNELMPLSVMLDFLFWLIGMIFIVKFTQ